MRQQTPLTLSPFAGKTGFDKPYPMEGDWSEWAHTGEIAAVKGLQGLQGYPF